MSKRVLAINPDGSEYHITRQQAEREVHKELADWDDRVVRNFIVRRHRCDQGMNDTHFEDVWQRKLSGGIRVWQVRRGAFAGNSKED